VGETSPRWDDLLLAVFADRVAGETAVDDEVRLGGGLPGLEEDLAGPDLPDPEAAGELLEDLGVGVAAQDRQFGERLRDHSDVVRAVLLELDPAPADAERQAPVDPVGAALDVHPGQRLQQPSRGDGLHLGLGLGGGCQLARGLGAEAGECAVCGWCESGLFGGGTGDTVRYGHFPSRDMNRREQNGW
jgi:hypothetical protein